MQSEDIIKAKQISIVDFLMSEFNVDFSKHLHKDNIVICNPARNEKNPSLSISVSKNLWKDHAEGVGGSIIDFVMCFYCKDFKEAVKYLLNSNLEAANNLFLSSPQSLSSDSDSSYSDYEILTIDDDIKYNLLKKYLRERKVLDVYKPYLKQIEYRFKNKKYFALGFENNLGGYELRNAIIKQSIGCKYIKTFKIKENALSAHISVFEGIFDFLSALVYFGKKRTSDALILNSVTQKKDAYDIIAKYQKVNLFLDNDESGKKLVSEIIYKYPDKNIVDYSYLYKNYKDFNDFLTCS